MRAIPFRQRLQLTLAAARVSQAEIARVAGLDAKHLNDLCQGRRKNVSAQTVYALATALGCTSDWLLGLTNVGPAPMAVRQSIGQRGGRVMQYVGVEAIDPINQNAGVRSRRGLVRGQAPKRVEEDDDDGLP